MSTCQLTPPLNCSADCQVTYPSDEKDAEPIEVTTSSVEVVGTFFGLCLTIMASGCLCMSCACCFTWRLFRLTETKGDSLVGTIKPSSIGVPSGSGAIKSPVDVEKLQRSANGCFSWTGTLLTYLSVVGIIGGIWVGAVLKYFHNRELSIRGKELPAEAASAGFAVSALFVLCICLIWIAICILKKKFRMFLKHLGENSVSQQDLQLKLAEKVIDKLRSDEGEKARSFLLQAGIGEDQIQRILTAPPEQMGELALELLTGRVLAELLCKFMEDTARVYFEENLKMFALVFLGFPSLICAVVLWLSAFCVQFKQPTAASVVSLLLLLVCAALYFDWMKIYTIGFTALHFSLWGLIFGLWAQHGPTGFSIALWLQSMPQFTIWFNFAMIWSCYLKPIAEALFNMVMEQCKVMTWRGFGLERDPQHLLDRKDDVISAGGCLAERMGLREFLREVETE